MLDVYYGKNKDDYEVVKKALDIACKILEEKTKNNMYVRGTPWKEYLLIEAIEELNNEKRKTMV